MDTKLKGDIAEQAAVLEALKRGWGVLHPVGDRLPYDLVFDVNGCLVKVQVKAAWLDSTSTNYTMDTRRTKTNRRVMVRDSYRASDFDFALVYVAELNVFYVLPVDVFLSFRSGISLVEVARRQRRPRSADYRDAWHLIASRAGSLQGSEGSGEDASDACAESNPIRDGAPLQPQVHRSARVRTR